MFITVLHPLSNQDVILGGLAAGRMLCFWPALPARLMRPGPEESLVIDHVTLDLVSKRSHLTAFTPQDTRCRPCCWSLPRVASGRRVWIYGAIRWRVLPPADSTLEVTVSLPTSDVERRSSEWCRFVSSGSFRDVRLPCAPEGTDFVLFQVGLLSSSDDIKRIERGQPPAFDEWVAGYAKPQEVGVTAFALGGVWLSVCTWLPGGGLRDDVLLGAPRLNRRGSQ